MCDFRWLVQAAEKKGWIQSSLRTSSRFCSPDFSDIPSFMWYPVASLRSTSSGEFTRFWGGLYKYDNPELYDRNIGKLLTRERVLDLFAWKNGRRLSERKMQTVERHFLSRLAENADFSDDSKAKDFLEQYDSDGVIWRIFFLHICLPEKFPIFDQHVYRAMKAIQTRTPTELPNVQRRIVSIYLNDYCPFHADMGGIGRQVDKALWTFGRFIKAYRSLGILDSRRDSGAGLAF